MSLAPLIRVLLTEDVSADAELEVREMKRAGLRVTHKIADTERTFTDALREFDPDIILSDFSMPHFDGMSALALARELRPQTPFIFVSGTIGEEYAIRALKNGATDYVLKTNLVRLPAAVERALADAQQRRRLVRLSRVREFSSHINWALVRLRNRDELLAAICRIAVEVGGLSGARIGLVDAPDADVRWVGLYGAWQEGGPSPLRISARDDETGSGLGGRALRSLVPTVANDLANDARVRAPERLLQQGVKAMAALPLVVDGAASGVISLLASETGFFDQEEVGVLSELAANVSFALELMAKQERIDYLALYDALTGLPNRTLFNDRLTQAMQAAAGRKLALLLVDIERFKGINDAFGQGVGDKLLKAMGQRLHEAMGDINRVARLGSNLFGAMLFGIKRPEDVARAIEQAALFARPFEVDGREVRLSAKTGIAVFPDDGLETGALFRNAEGALRRAKEQGERYVFYAPEINARVSEQVELEHRLSRAVEQGELFLHYQPKYELATKRIVGLEALMRWRAPDGALVSPAKFVPVLEQTGLILEAGRQVLAAANRAHGDWQRAGLKPPRIAVNVSALQLRRPSFVADVRAALSGTPESSGVDVEVTESILMADIASSIDKLRELRDMGLLIALDDFGTGYSSLSYLSKLPLDTLKIDRSFVRGMTENADDTSIVSSIISLAQALRLKVVAEGVETEPQAQLLTLLRCDQAQGFLYSKPLPEREIVALLAQESADKPL